MVYSFKKKNRFNLEFKRLKKKENNLKVTKSDDT